jgi:hypothetical protein
MEQEFSGTNPISTKVEFPERFLTNIFAPQVGEGWAAAFIIYLYHLLLS